MSMFNPSRPSWAARQCAAISNGWGTSGARTPSRTSFRMVATAVWGAPRLPPETSSSGPSSGSPSRRRASSRGTGRDRAGIGRPVTRYLGPSRPAIGNERKTRRANGAARRLARPRCASASISAVGMRLRAAASTIGPPT